MWKALLAGTAAIAIAGSSLVYAQQRGDNAPSRWRPSAEDHAAFADAKIAALKAGLKLTPEQEKLWPSFESALRDIAKTRMDRRAERRTGERQPEQRSDDPVGALRRQAEALSTAGANLKRLADAQEPLYQSLDDGQKNRFRILARILTSNRSHFAMMRGQGGMRGMHERHHGRDGMREMHERHHGGTGGMPMRDRTGMGEHHDGMEEQL